MIRSVLVVEDDAAVREALGQTLDLGGFEPTLCGSFVAAKDMITRDFQGVILSDIRMSGRDGFYLLDYARGQDAELPVILLTGEGDIPMAVKAMGAGAFDFLEKPCAAKDLLAVLERALASRELVIENRSLKEQLVQGDPAARMIFGKSAAVDTLRSHVRAVAATGADVLVTGAPGTGVPKCAEVIHLLSPNARKPFEKRSAAALSVEELERALDKAEGGSLFLDEISLLPQETQFALAQRLETPAPRILAGCTRDLDDMVSKGEFSSDLYYRLEGVRVYIPGLRERPEDIPIIFRQYVAQAAEQAGVTAPEITPDTIARLMAQDWPGNARALMNAAMRFALGLGDVSEDQTLGLAEQMAQVERSLLIEALRKHAGQATAAAKALKLPRKTFYDKLTRHGIRPEDFRSE
ncbi:MAG: sigma-54 dependent transcriptional regulator [Donghicola eburneus]|nr:sigma-54 dependent transcriptional regulator [Donghicola eburneus]MCI5042584.1 sigma-54 dependent transcriptional regulator [Donghicola eburneus]